jgi:hypothetical protein
MVETEGFRMSEENDPVVAHKVLSHAMTAVYLSDWPREVRDGAATRLAECALKAQPIIESPRES